MAFFFFYLYLPYLTSLAHIVYRLIFLLYYWLCLFYSMCNSVLLYVSNCVALSWPGRNCKWELVLNLPTWLNKGEIKNKNKSLKGLMLALVLVWRTGTLGTSWILRASPGTSGSLRASPSSSTSSWNCGGTVGRDNWPGGVFPVSSCVLPTPSRGYSSHGSFDTFGLLLPLHMTLCWCAKNPCDILGLRCQKHSDSLALFNYRQIFLHYRHGNVLTCPDMQVGVPEPP